MLCMSYLTSFAQKDSTIFKGYLSNNEYEVYLQINFYQNDIKVPGQEIFGTIAGFLGDRKDSRKWLITNAAIEGKTAHLSIINDYGSEDLIADLTLESDGTYSLKQITGSNIKIARNRKWVKIPKKLTFMKK
jgi:hypothetical protein